MCGVSVNVANLEKHVKNRHPHADVEVGSLVTKQERLAAQPHKGRARTSRGGLAIVAVVAVLLLLILGIVILNPFRNVGPNVGQIAPDFTLTTTAGASVTLSSYRDRPTLLEFMDVDCEFCQREAPVLASVYANYSSRVHFLSVDVNFIGAQDTNLRIEQFKTTHSTMWTYALDTTRTSSAYGVTGTPTTFILDRNGVVVEVFRGVAPSGAASYSATLDRALQV